MTPTSIETVTGKLLDLANPDPSQIDIVDIAWSLSRAARFGGHTVNEVPYNVAAHSIAVSDIIKVQHPDFSEKKLIRLQLLGLLHDASECYTSDISGPLKKIPELRAAIKPIEHKIQETIYKALSIDPPTIEEETIIKEADLYSQTVEAYNFMPSRGLHWNGMPKIPLRELQQFKEPTSSLTSFEEFIERFNDLLDKRI